MSGSGNDSLVFNYIVGDHQESMDLDYRDSRPFDWGDGRVWNSIKDKDGGTILEKFYDNQEKNYLGILF